MLKAFILSHYLYRVTFIPIFYGQLFLHTPIKLQVYVVITLDLLNSALPRTINVVIALCAAKLAYRITPPGFYSELLHPTLVYYTILIEVHATQSQALVNSNPT